MAVPKPMQTEFGIHPGLGKLCLSFKIFFNLASLRFGKSNTIQKSSIEIVKEMEGIGEKSRIFDGFYASSIGCHNMILKPSTDVLWYTLKIQKPKSWNLIKSQE